MTALTIGQIELVAAYTLVTAFLLVILFWSRVRWWIKAGAIALAVTFFFGTWTGLRNISGWPSDEKLPERFELVWAIIVEPDETTQDPGALYYWLLELRDDSPLEEEDIYRPGSIDVRLDPTQLPRAIRIPYSRGAHEEAEEARNKIIQGVRQVGLTTRRPKKPGEYAPESEFAFYDRPDPILAPKAPPP
ncbi:MAG: hypothetical protein CMM34_01700 [Rhodospirillaceae bacterium]|nr:hypothetical protein [Rhodospirillaceae bacterium]